METLGLRKHANAFIPEATPSDVMPAAVLSAIYRFRRRHGGLWVGGTVLVSSGGEFGWITGIVVVRHAGSEFRFRCYGAKRLAATMVATFNVGSATPAA